MLPSGAEIREACASPSRSCGAKEKKENGSFSSDIKKKKCNTSEDLPFSCNLDKTLRLLISQKNTPTQPHTACAGLKYCFTHKNNFISTCRQSQAQARESQHLPAVAASVRASSRGAEGMELPPGPACVMQGRRNRHTG